MLTYEYIYTYSIYTYIYATIIKQEGNELKREQGWVHGRIWREDRKGRMM